METDGIPAAKTFFQHPPTSLIDDRCTNKMAIREHIDHSINQWIVFKLPTSYILLAEPQNLSLVYDIPTHQQSEAAAYRLLLSSRHWKEPENE